MGKLRQHESKEVSELAKEIVKKWKNDVDKAKSGSKIPAHGRQPGASSPSSPLASHAPPVRRQSTSATPVPATPTANGKSDARSAKSDGVAIQPTGDKTRDRCAELIYDGLAHDSGARESLVSHGCALHTIYFPASDLILDRAIAVEKAVFAQFNDVNQDYKGKLRSLYVNLKDKTNPSLRESIVSGELSPEKFSKMSSEVRVTSYLAFRTLIRARK